MQRLILLIPLAFLLFINSCALADPQSNIPDEVGTAVAYTQTAAVWTVAPSPTFNPNISIMVNWLNADLVSPTNALGSTMDAKYSVTDITFRNHSPMTFRIDVSCICMSNADCCIPERTFVIILDSLKRNSPATLAQVPPDVSQMIVVCTNQANRPIGAISVSWQAVREYLEGYLSGYQLGVQITKTLAP